MNSKSHDSDAQPHEQTAPPSSSELNPTPPPPPPPWRRTRTPTPPPLWTRPKSPPSSSNSLPFFQPSADHQIYTSQSNAPQPWATTSALHDPSHPYYTNLPWHGLPSLSSIANPMSGHGVYSPGAQPAIYGQQQSDGIQNDPAGALPGYGTHNPYGQPTVHNPQQQQGHQGMSPQDASNATPSAHTGRQKHKKLQNLEKIISTLQQRANQELPLQQPPAQQQPPPRKEHPQELSIRQRPVKQPQIERDPVPVLTAKDVENIKRKARKHKDPKIMLPGPRPTKEYLLAANGEAYVIDPPARMLVILDLNGTLIYRPNPRKQPTLMVARPFLKPFLSFLFENFSVMVWSSAKPENVRVIVENALPVELRSKLVATWARDSFGLTPENYTRNVQVYKDLNMVWAKEEIQSQASDYHLGQRFGQDNTILIDDSAIKAVGQPHNLIEIPEFEATKKQMESDILREVAGYLQTARMQYNVSSFMKQFPFKADGNWQFDWDEDLAEPGEVIEN